MFNILHASPPPDTAPARDRLLVAALAVFSQNGLQGATTKAIAAQAGVNEVTLFRLFGSKENLLGELLSCMVAAVMNEKRPENEDEAWRTGDLRTNLRRFAEHHYELLSGSEAFIRAMVGEARRHPEHARKILHEAGSPLRERFAAQLAVARKAGKIRRGPDLMLAAQAFMDTVFSAMLRHTAGFCGADESPKQFIATFTDIFAAGLAAHEPTPSPGAAARASRTATRRAVAKN
ncbi:MAG: TetR/AcrR family transcriptional regulator [Prosthecobacter sp.]